MSRHLAAWRLAARMVRRAPARSVLVAALVALPVVAGVFADVAYRSAQLSPAEAATRYLGRADAIAVVTPLARLDPAGSQIGRGPTYTGQADAIEGSPEPYASRPATSVDVPSLLPPGAHATVASTKRSVSISSGGRTDPTVAVATDLADPLTRGLYGMTAGRAPRNDGEVAVTAPLAHRLRLHVGSSVSLHGRQVVVTAIVRDLSALSAEEVVGRAATFGGLASFESSGFQQEVTWLIAFPGHRAPDLHDALAAHGVLYETRHQWEFPNLQGFSAGYLNGQTYVLLGSILGFGFLEIVLLAGTAFAVGVRRQVRDFGLVRTAGGDERDVRRVILAQGTLLGLLGGVAGVGLGVLAEVLARPALEGYLDHAFGSLDVRAVEVLAVLLVGVLAAYLAALVPARGSARLPIVDMLKARFRVDGVAHNPRWAWVALFLGPLVVVGGAWGWHRSYATGTAGATSLLSGLRYGGGGHHVRWTVLLSVGAAIALAGLTRSVPVLLARLGRRAGRLPLTLRLSVRDCARHWHRSAPATAAVATVIAGAVLVLFVASSNNVRDARAYQPQLPRGAMSVAVAGAAASPSALSAAMAKVRSGLDVRAAGVVSIVQTHHPVRDSIGAHSVGCDVETNACTVASVGVADGGALAALAGRPVPGADAALAAGRWVVTDPSLLRAGKVGLDVTSERGVMNSTATITLPAYLLPLPRYAGLPSLFVPPSFVKSMHWVTRVQEAVVRPAAPPSSATVHRLSAALGDSASVYVERGPQARLGALLLVLLLASGLATLVGTSIAVALAMAESRADMATLAAVGASPGRRRLAAMGQAAVVSGLGAVLGLGLGVLVGVSLLQGSTSYPFSAPLRFIAVTVLVAPAVAVLVAGAVTRSRVPLTRRLA